MKGFYIWGFWATIALASAYFNPRDHAVVEVHTDNVPNVYFENIGTLLNTASNLVTRLDIDANPMADMAKLVFGTIDRILRSHSEELLEVAVKLGNSALNGAMKTYMAAAERNISEGKFNSFLLASPTILTFLAKQENGHSLAYLDNGFSFIHDMLVLKDRVSIASFGVCITKRLSMYSMN